LLQILFAATAMTLVVGWGAPGVDALSDMSAMQRGGLLAFWIAAGVIAYLAALRLAGLRLSILWSPTTENRHAP
jgi:hypothetical protein